MDKKLLQKAYKENNFKLLQETYKKEELEQIPHQIICKKLEITNQLEICNWLFQNGVDYDAKDKLGNTGIMIACFMKNKEFVKLYLSLNTEIEPKEGITPLMLALEGLIDNEIVELLLKANTNVDKITTYNNEQISPISLAYQNAKSNIFEKLVKKSKNIINHYKIIQKINNNFPIKNTATKNDILNKYYNNYKEYYYNKEPLNSLKNLIKKYELKTLIDKIILNEESKKIKCINAENNEYLYEDNKIRIYFSKENTTDEINFIDILINEEIIHPEIKKERIKKQTELNNKIKEYNNSFKINLGYERELDNKKIKNICKEEIKSTKKNKKEPTSYTSNDYYKYSNENIERELLSKYSNSNKINNYIFEYLDENDFRKKERSVKKYNMLAYKKLTFEYYPELHKGNFKGKITSQNTIKQIDHYELELPTIDLFKKVHGPIIVHYSVCYKNKTILFTNITPENILDEGHKAELTTYKGVMISKSNGEKDMFKINLLNMLDK